MQVSWCGRWWVDSLSREAWIRIDLQGSDDPPNSSGAISESRHLPLENILAEIELLIAPRSGPLGVRFHADSRSSTFL